VDAFVNGDLKRAEGLHRKLYWLFKDLFIEPNPVPIKTALSWRGTILAEVRLPLCEMSAANQTRLRKPRGEFKLKYCYSCSCRRRRRQNSCPCHWRQRRVQQRQIRRRRW